MLAVSVAVAARADRTQNGARAARRIAGHPAIAIRACALRVVPAIGTDRQGARDHACGWWLADDDFFTGRRVVRLRANLQSVRSLSRSLRPQRGPTQDVTPLDTLGNVAIPDLDRERGASLEAIAVVNRPIGARPVGSGLGARTRARASTGACCQADDEPDPRRRPSAPKIATRLFHFSLFGPIQPARVAELVVVDAMRGARPRKVPRMA
jgi:hypothetical protein